MTRKLIENWRKWRHLDAESAVVQETPWESSFLRTSPSCIFLELFCRPIYLRIFFYNFGDLYHRTCFTQPTQILHVLLTYIAMSNRALFECSNIRIFEYSNIRTIWGIRIIPLGFEYYFCIRIFEYSTTALIIAYDFEEAASWILVTGVIYVSWIHFVGYTQSIRFWQVRLGTETVFHRIVLYCIILNYLTSLQYNSQHRTANDRTQWLVSERRRGISRRWQRQSTDTADVDQSTADIRCHGELRQAP